MKKFLAVLMALVTVAFGQINNNSSYNYTQRQWFKQGLTLVPTTVAQLPSSPSLGMHWVVSDGVNAGDCSVGLGTFQVSCIYTPGGWVSVGSTFLGGTVPNPTTFNSNVAMPEQSKGFTNAITDCSVVTSGDAFATLQACVNAHPGSEILLPKIQAWGSGTCDYNLSQTVMLLGAGQIIEGEGSPNTGSGAVKVCTTQVGVTAFWGNNQYAPAFIIRNLAIQGVEPFATATIADFVLPYGWSYPSVPWITGSTSSSTTLTTTGASELFLSQNAGQTVMVEAGGATIGTTSCTTIANSASITCTSPTQSAVGESIYIPGAGPSGANLSAKIVGYCVSSCPSLTNGTYQLDRVASTVVTSVTSTYAYDLYATISSVTNTHNAVLSAAGSNNFTGLTVFIGSRADGIRSNSVFAQMINVTATNFGRNGINIASGGAIQDMPYIGVTGRASDLADDNLVVPTYLGGNRGNGLYIAGGDGNDTRVIGGDYAVNQLWGYMDNSFLGSAAYVPHVATNHNDCTSKPCGSLGGAPNFSAVTGTLKSSLNAAIITFSDGTCTASSNSVTKTANAFTASQVGMLIQLNGCGASGANLLTTIATYVSPTSITVTDTPSTTVTGTMVGTTYPTVTKTTGTAFASGMVGHDISVVGAGANGQALYAHIAQFYSANIVGIDTAPVQGASGTTVYYGSTNYAGRDIWMTAFQFTTGAITTGTNTLTLSGANPNEQFVAQMCSGATNSLDGPQFIVVGAGPNGLNLNATCSIFGSATSITLNNNASTTVSGATIYVQAYGGSYNIPNPTGPSYVYSGYGEADQLEGPRMATNGNFFVGGVVSDGWSASPGTQYVTSTTTNKSLTDTGMNLIYQVGKTFSQSFDWFINDYNGTTMWDYEKNASNDFRFINGNASGTLRLWFLNAGANQYYCDKALSGTSNCHRFYGASGGSQLEVARIDATGNFYFDVNTNSTHYFEFSGTPTSTRTITVPDQSGTLMETTNLGISATAPTVSSGFGTGASVVSNNGTFAFVLSVGNPNSATSGVLTMPTAHTGWACDITDTTNPGTNFTRVSATSTTSITLSNYNSAGTLTAWANSDQLTLMCAAY